MPQILIVDDSESVRKEVTEFFTNHNIKIVTAKDGIEGIDLLKSNKEVKIILVDIHMPVMDGTTMIETIRSEFPKDQFKIFILTSEVTFSLKQWGQENNVMGFLMKPFNGPLILSLMKKIL